uniref:E3 ubiquitin-protein ligase n=1 Tax=Saccoglossus kowalevskii TaxID=10224 RepID=A0ABM0M713_SACKO|nr:PREDICTED: E3 ubiquitin-protein ligase UBR2-like [Saccoglossus kowalevskii]
MKNSNRRDCAADPTCVFCIDCFQKSAHKLHRYRMSTSGGGGFCDCGDEEAWKQHHSCEMHSQAPDQPAQNPMERLPSEMKLKTALLFEIVLNYACDLLSWEQCDTLPSGLQPSTLDDIYCTMLFNDETHSYAEVIDNLKKAVDCTHKDAVEFATIVDREGRNSVVEGKFRICEHARSTIQRNTSRHGNAALKVHVMHMSVVAHQTFAMKLLAWLTEVIVHSDGLQQLLCIECMKMFKDTDKVLIEHVMLMDTKLWKAARVAWHQVIMSSLLMNQEFKKKFAILYTKVYSDLQSDFIEDDHDHGVSVTSLSVQMFTVPTLSRMLIVEHDLFSIVLRTFIKYAATCKEGESKLRIDRTSLQKHSIRMLFTSVDLRYILSSKPDEWEPKLRKKFVEGVCVLLELLAAMQGVDSVTRQVGQHIEVEPDWENVFNLQAKIGSIISMVIDWCGSDRSVLVEVYRETMKMLRQISGPFASAIKRKVANYECSCMSYDVSSQPVSVHLPLTRFLAGLHLHLQKHRVSYFSEGFLPPQALTPVEMVEESLRTQVMVAQVQAGMWRRNGYSLLNQLYFYHSGRCRMEMQDRDIHMLQIGGVLMDPNEYIITLLNKFNLVNVMRESYDKIPPTGSEETQKQMHSDTLTEEFLGLLIVILSERYATGIGEITEEDRVSREVIQQLCICPMAHSELSKKLTEDHNHETGLESVIHKVAIFKKPGATGKGLYELKPEYFEKYDPFFYHYSKAEQSKSEETQRKRKKANGEGEALPPPVPPQCTDAFKPLSRLLHCDVMTHVFCTILRRATTFRSRGWTETMVQRTLYLIGLALHEENIYHNQQEDFGFINKATSGSPCLLTLLENLAKVQKLEEHKDLLSWVLKTFAAVQQLKGKESTSVEVKTDIDAEKEKKRKAELAQQRRARIMAQMSAMQKNFIKVNAELFQETSTELDFESGGSSMDTSEFSAQYPVAVGAKRTKVTEFGLTRCTCILCQEDQELTLDGRAMILASLVQRSTVLSKSRGKTIKDTEKYDPLFVPPDLFWGTHVSTCGHVMHFDCWQRLFESVVAKVQRRPLGFRSYLSFDVDKHEYLCPLCESLSNAVLPLLPHPAMQLSSSAEGSETEKTSDLEVSYNDWLDGIQSILRASIESAAKLKQSDDLDGSLLDPCPIPSLTRMMAQTVAENFQLIWEYVYASTSQFSDSVKEMIKMFTRSSFMVGLNSMPNDEDERVAILAWCTCAYTIHTTENLLRDEAKPLFGALSSRQSDCLNALVRFAAVCGHVTNTTAGQKHALRLLSTITAIEDAVETLPCILDIDMFTLLVNTCLSIPLLQHSDSGINTQLSGESINHQHVLQITMTAHIMQILLTPWSASSDCEMEQDGNVEAQQLLEIYKQVHMLVGVTPEMVPSPWQLWCHLRKSCLPFLRCAALFFHFLTGVASPAELQNVGLNEFESLCKYLSMPSNLTLLFDNENSLQMKCILERWCKHPDIKTKLCASSTLVRHPLEVNQLIQLPQDYSELINSPGISLFVCPRGDSRAPALCLLCGSILCSQIYCCQNEVDGEILGACMTHTFTCAAGIGIFLRVRECQIMILSKNKGCFFTPPYLDDYGETDQGLKRGNPLHLCKERYRKLQKLWLLHGLPEEIAHQLESNKKLFDIDWPNL